MNFSDSTCLLSKVEYICNMASSNPTYKDVVMELMPFVKQEEEQCENVSSSTTTTTKGRPRKAKKKVWLTHQCPREACSKKTVRFLQGSGYKNPFSHLVSCYAKGKSTNERETYIFLLYEEALAKKVADGGSIRSHFDSNQAGGDGGGIYIEGELFMQNSLLTGNKCISSTIKPNEQVKGGALYIDEESKVQLHKCTIEGE